jgi:hypothetical protein
MTTSPGTVARGGQLEFTSPEAAELTRVVRIRPASTTHEIDSEQRSLPLTFTVSGTTVTAQVPGSANLAPLGHYVLFALNGSGVPALAPWVRLT